MSEKKLSGRQIKDLFYTEVSSETDEGGNETTTTFRCRCGKLRAQSLKHGYTNLTQHILMKHPEWVTALMEDLNIIPKASVAHQPPPKEKGGTGSMRALGSMIKHYREIRTKPAAAAAAACGDGGGLINGAVSESSLTESMSVTTETVVTNEPQRRLQEGYEEHGGSSIDHQQQPSETEHQQQVDQHQEQHPMPTTTNVVTMPLAVPNIAEEVVAVAAAPGAGASENVHKRTDYLSWDDYFMSVAFLSAMRSKGIVDTFCLVSCEVIWIGALIVFGCCWS